MEQERATPTQNLYRRRRSDWGLEPMRRAANERRRAQGVAAPPPRARAGEPSPAKLREIQELVRWGAIEI